jgi:hypothetical protein
MAQNHASSNSAPFAVSQATRGGLNRRALIGPERVSRRGGHALKKGSTRGQSPVIFNFQGSILPTNLHEHVQVHNPSRPSRVFNIAVTVSGASARHYGYTTRVASSAPPSRALVKGPLRSPEPRQLKPSASYTVPSSLKNEVALERPGTRKPEGMNTRLTCQSTDRKAYPATAPVPYSEFSSTAVAQPFVNPTGVFDGLGRSNGNP